MKTFLLFPTPPSASNLNCLLFSLGSSSIKKKQNLFLIYVFLIKQQKKGNSVFVLLDISFETTEVHNLWDCQWRKAVSTVSMGV